MVTLLAESSQSGGMLQDKLEAALAEAHKAQTESMSDVRWRGTVVNVKNDKVRCDGR